MPFIPNTSKKMTEINTDLTIAELIMRFAKLRGYTQKTLREEFNKRYGTDYIQPAFSRMLTRGAIRYDELKQIGDILGFNIVLKPRD